MTYSNHDQRYSGDPEEPSPGARFNTSAPHPARIYNYWLGGKDNYAADRKAAEEVIRLRPQVVGSALANRYFLTRVVRYLTVSIQGAGLRP